MKRGAQRALHPGKQTDGPGGQPERKGTPDQGRRHSDDKEMRSVDTGSIREWLVYQRDVEAVRCYYLSHNAKTALAHLPPNKQRVASDRSLREGSTAKKAARNSDYQANLEISQMETRWSLPERIACRSARQLTCQRPSTAIEACPLHGSLGNPDNRSGTRCLRRHWANC